jgi:hypothetical protein
VSPAAELEAKIAAEVRRLVDRLATLTTTRLAEPAPPYASRATAAHALAQRFVDVTADVEDHAPIPSLPWIDELTVADQLAVTAQDLQTALAARDVSGATNIARLTELLEDIRRVRAAVR